MTTEPFDMELQPEGSEIVDEEEQIELPDDFETEEEFLSYIRKMYRRDVSSDEYNRRAAREDFRFAAGDQWPDAIKSRRERADKPVLTFNRLPAFIGQIYGNRLETETSISVHPMDNDDKEAALVRQGLIRAIEKISNATQVYNNGYLQQVIGGRGNWQIVIDYADYDAFDQDIKIDRIDNPFGVIWDYQSTDPSGADARHVFVVDSVDIDTFRANYPDKAPTDITQDADVLGELRTDGWWDGENVRLGMFWRMRQEPRTIALLQNGATVDITGFDEMQIAALPAPIASYPNGELIMRGTLRPYCEGYLVSGSAVLEGPYRLPISSVPVIRADGWVIPIGERRERFGVVRFMKDPQRLHNYWRSQVAQKLAQTPNNTWLAGKSAVRGLENEFRNAARSDDPLLTFNDDSGAPPQRVEPAQMEPALLNEAALSAQDLREISGMHESAMGAMGNEVSGAGIRERVRTAAIGHAIYNKNLDYAIERTGRLINELIPYVYNSTRTVVILGEGGEELREINAGGDTPDLTFGKYRVAVSTGPSFATKRMEQAEAMMAMVNAMPQTMAIAADQIVEAQDWPGADKIAARLRMQLPPGTVQPDEMSPQQRQMVQSAQQAQAQAQQLEEAMRMAELQMKQAQARDYDARAVDAEARALKTLNSIDLEEFKAITTAEDKALDNQVKVLNMFRDMLKQEQGNDRGNS